MGLAEVEAFLAALPIGGAADIPEPLPEIAAWRPNLYREAHQVTLFGAAKTGKSTLLNSLLGADLVPIHPARSAGYVTPVRYGRTRDR
jgi:ribosome biogenesis GTPase A